MTEVKNPFRPTRFEHQRDPLIWISPGVRRLEDLKSAYVAGTRGSGKTSLLKAIHWRERQYNSTVRDQLGEDAPDYVAVYFRLPDYLTTAIGVVDWSRAFPDSPEPRALAFQLFSQLIEFVSAQLICEAVAALRANGRFRFGVDEEEEAVERLVRRYPPLGGVERPRSLDDLSLAFERMHQRVNVLITRGRMAEALDGTLDAQPGVFINDLASLVRDLACGTDGICSPGFHIKICIDDCETLKTLQQRFLNTLVRGSRYPLFWIISFVTVDYDSTNTVRENQTLSDADRSQIILDAMDSNEFYRLCEQVSRLRVYYSDEGGTGVPLAGLPRDYFRLRDVLGRLSVNDAILDAAKDSISREFWDLVERSRLATTRRSKVPPIYQTYVLERLGPRLEDKREENVGAYLRRKEVAAMLAILAEFRLSKIPYVGATTLIRLSNNCIRDYLELMGSVFQLALDKGELKGVRDLQCREDPISEDTQREAVRSSSREKFRGIRNSFERDWSEAERTIEFIGKLTARLQANPASLSTLATPERGNFLFDLDAIGRLQGARPQTRDLVERILRRCEADGLLRPARAGQVGDDGEGPEFIYHLHRRFAPQFGFSYRGPYGLLRMPMREFVQACDSASDLTVDECVARAYARIQREDPADQDRLL